MNLLMISGDRTLAAGKPGAFLQTLEGLSKEFERIDILCPHVTHVVTTVLFSNVFLHPSSSGLLFQPWWIAKEGQRLFGLHKHNVMTVHDYPPFYNSIGARTLQKKIGIPMVLEIHHIVGWPVAASFSEFIGRLLSRIYLPYAAKKAKAIRVVNDTVKSLLMSWNISEETLSVVSSFYLDEALLQANDQPKMYDMAFAARLVDNKGLDQFLCAVEQLPNAKAVVIGDGPLLQSSKEWCMKHGIADRTEFTGWLKTHDEVIEKLRTAKVSVMCSTSEGGPRVALEAMACGIPLVATNVGIIPEVLEDGVNGYLTTGKAEDIVSHVKLLLSDAALRQRMGMLARASVLPRFAKTTTLPAYAKFLQDAA